MQLLQQKSAVIVSQELKAQQIAIKGVFSTFPASTRVGELNCGYTATQLELGNEVTHGGGINSKHAAYLCSKREDI